MTVKIGTWMLGFFTVLWASAHLLSDHFDVPFVGREIGFWLIGAGWVAVLAGALLERISAGKKP